MTPVRLEPAVSWQGYRLTFFRQGQARPLKKQNDWGPRPKLRGPGFGVKLNPFQYHCQAFALLIRDPPLIIYRALTPLFGNGAHGIGKIRGVLTKIGKFDIILMYDVSIARLIPARSKCYYILLFCEILICNNMFCIYII